MANSIADLLLGAMGREDPREKLAQYFSQGVAGATTQAPPQQQAQQINQDAQSSNQNANVGGPQQQNQQQQSNEPQAYQSPADLFKLNQALIDRQQSSEMINRGMGMLFAGFAQPQDRANMVNAMSGMSQMGGTASEQMTSMMKLQDTMIQRQMFLQQIKMAPIYAQQLKIPVEQVIAYIQQGKLPEIMQKIQEQQAALADPLHQAQTAQAGAGAKKDIAETAVIGPKAESEIAAQKAAAAASTAAAQKTGAEIPTIAPTAAATIAEKNAAAAASTASAQKTGAEIPTIAPAAAAALDKSKAETALAGAQTSAVPATIAKTQADTELAQQQAAKAAADAAARANLAKLASDPDFTKKYGITPAQAQALPPDELAKLVSTGPQEATTTSAKTQASAKIQLDSLRGEYDKHQALIDDITKSPVLDEITGKIAGRLPSVMAPWLSAKGNSQDAINLQQKVDQLSHMGFLAGAHAVREAVGARVSNVEAVAGNEAETRLHDQSQSASAYRAAIQQVKEESDRNMAIAYKQAGIPIPDDLPDVKKAAEKLDPGTGPLSTTIQRPDQAPKPRTGHYDKDQHKVIYD